MTAATASDPHASPAPRARGHRDRAFSFGEELANSLVHGVGAVLAVAGLVVLVVLAASRGTAWHVVSSALFGASLVLLYTCSSLYHALPRSWGRLKHTLHSLDQTAIYLLIACSYTPFMLVTLRGAWGWSLLGVVWTLAAVGITMQFARRERCQVKQTALYLAMGWAVVVAIVPLVRALDATGLVLLVAGGLAYTIGVLFYVWWSLPYHHAVWHAFVLAGSILHWCAVTTSVIPPPAAG